MVYQLNEYEFDELEKPTKRSTGGDVVAGLVFLTVAGLVASLVTVIVSGTSNSLEDWKERSKLNKLNIEAQLLLCLDEWDHECYFDLLEQTDPRRFKNERQAVVSQRLEDEQHLRESDWNFLFSHNYPQYVELGIQYFLDRKDFIGLIEFVKKYDPENYEAYLKKYDPLAHKALICKRDRANTDQVVKKHVTDALNQNTGITFPSWVEYPYNTTRKSGGQCILVVKSFVDSFAQSFGASIKVRNTYQVTLKGTFPDKSPNKVLWELAKPVNLSAFDGEGSAKSWEIFEGLFLSK